MDNFVLFIVLLLLFSCEASPDCDSYTDCETCTIHESWIGGKCRWCPLDRECHAFASLENTCKVDQNIKSPSQCQTGHKAYGVYNPQLAYSATLLSAIAYSDTPEECMKNIYPNSGFELLNGVGHKCEDLILFQYDECYAYTTISHTMKMIVLAYRGTTNRLGNQQLYDEILSTLGIPKTPFLIGGEIQHYFNQAYDKLFPCVRSSIEELVREYPDYDVVITGHSLGGALASLSAASLIYTGIVRENKLSLYTFGMPRVGDKGYAINHDRIVNSSWRVVHGRDVVAHLPTCNPILGCRVTASGPYHHRTEIFYKADPMTISSTYKQCEGNEDDRCSDGLVTKNWCLPGVDLDDCIDYHKVYFGIPVGTYCNEKGSRRKRSATERSRMWDKFSSDECRRINISKGSTTVNAATKTSKMQEISLIFITLMIFKSALI